jgi:hypothetical protein
MVVLSSGWRKGLYFDLDPLRDGAEERDYDVEKDLGSCMAYLFNAPIASMCREDWNFMIGRGWFPFIGLPPRLSRNLVGFARSKIDLEVVLPEVSDPHPAHPAKGERVNYARERQQTSRGWDYALGRDMFRATN